MTTYTLNGFVVTYDVSDNPITFQDVTLEAVFRDGEGFINYAILQTFADDLPEVEIDSSVVNLRLGGVDFPDTTEDAIGFVTTPQGTHVVMAFEDLDTGEDFIFQIGGDPLTMPTSLAEFEALENSITAIGQVTSGPFRPGVDIAVADFPGVTSTENDLMTGTSGDDALFGGLGNDTLQGDAGHDRLEGGAGADRLFGGDGNDTVVGGNGRDRAFLGNGADLFQDNGQGGVLGQDTVFGGAGNDTIQGGNGNDRFFGQAGNDLIFGRLGNDRLLGGDGFDTLHGGAGNDTVVGGNGRDKAFMGAGADLFQDNGQGGVLGQDTVFGGAGNDTIQGGNGNDRFFGQAGNDLIFGRLGNDRLDGGAGDDTLTGGAGADTFVFRPGYGADRVTDFVTGIDTLGLGPALLGGAATGAEVVAQFASVTAAGVLFDFGAGDTVLLAGLDTTAGLTDDITIL